MIVMAFGAQVLQKFVSGPSGLGKVLQSGGLSQKGFRSPHHIPTPTIFLRARREGRSIGPKVLGVLLKVAAIHFRSQID